MLSLAKVWAERSQGTVSFKCEAILVNETGASLQVKSCFFSAFDGLRIVVFSDAGLKSAEQSYTAHQSPFKAEGQWFPIKKGENRKILSFPVVQFPKNFQKVRVLLLETLPGSEFTDILCSNLVPVSLTEAKN